MGTGGLQFLGHADIILEVVFRPVRVEDVAGVADHGLADLVVLHHRVHHLLQTHHMVVQNLTGNRGVSVSEQVAPPDLNR